MLPYIGYNINKLDEEETKKLFKGLIAMVINKSKLMKRAHKLAGKMKGDYQARLSLALRQLWEEKKVDKKPIIEDWWLRNNPAQDCLLNEFSDLEVTEETQKAVMFNREVWVPKSVIEWKEQTEGLSDDEKASIFLEKSKGTEWCDWKFDIAADDWAEDNDINYNNSYAKNYDYAVEKGYIK